MARMRHDTQIEALAAPATLGETKEREVEQQRKRIHAVAVGVGR